MSYVNYELIFIQLLSVQQLPAYHSYSLSLVLHILWSHWWEPSSSWYFHRRTRVKHIHKCLIGNCSLALLCFTLLYLWYRVLYTYVWYLATWLFLWILLLGLDAGERVGVMGWWGDEVMHLKGGFPLGLNVCRWYLSVCAWMGCDAMWCDVVCIKDNLDRPSLIFFDFFWGWIEPGWFGLV